MASREIRDLCPELRSKVIEFLARAKIAGIEVLIYCTYRPEKEQLQLYAQGRNGDKRPIVTWTKKGKHNLTDAKGNPAAEAFDCVPLVNGKPAWNARELYLQLAAIGRAIGLRWGSDWDDDGIPFERGETDSPHFELKR